MLINSYQCYFQYQWNMFNIKCFTDYIIEALNVCNNRWSGHKLLSAWPRQKIHRITVAQNMVLKQQKNWGCEMPQQFDHWIVFINITTSDFSGMFIYCTRYTLCYLPLLIVLNTITPAGKVKFPPSPPLLQNTVNYLNSQEQNAAHGQLQSYVWFL